MNRRIYAFWAVAFSIGVLCLAPIYNPPSGGGGVWGAITGTLSAQSDLATALGLKAPLASPALTGNPTAPTQTDGNNSTRIATTAYADVKQTAAQVQTLISNEVGVTLARGGYATTATAGGLTTLNVASKKVQRFTGELEQILRLPVASTLYLGWDVLVDNVGSDVISVQSSGADPIMDVIPGMAALLTCILASGTSEVSWEVIQVSGYATQSQVTNAIAASVAVGQRVLFDRLTPADSTSTDGTEDDLFTDEVPAGTVTASGQKITETEIVALAANGANSSRVRKYFGGTLIWDSAALSIPAGGRMVSLTTVAYYDGDKWKVVVTVIVSNSSSLFGNTLVTYTQDVSSSPGSPIVLKTTGTAAGLTASAGDISNKLATISFVPAGTVE